MGTPIISINDISAPYCDVCKAMLERLVERWNPGPKDNFPGEHHRTAKELRVAAASGCGICVQIMDEIHAMKLALKQIQNSSGKKLLLSFGFDRLTQNLEIFYQGTTLLTWAKLLSEHMRLDSKREEFSLIDYQSLRHEDTWDPEVVALARSWLSKCAQTHSTCRTELNIDYYPPRLLLLRDETVQLLNTATTRPRGLYATLSYCWGQNPRHLTLTTKNINRLHKGIKISQLAKTFRDAFRATKDLGITLIWVDSLCILQAGAGAEADWQKHLMEMSVIYSNGYLNIAADHGESVEDGCFVTRDPDSIKPCLIELQRPYTKMTPQPDTKTYILYSTSFWTRSIGDNPLVRRGWVHQERLLSPRILHFGARQLFWECSEDQACETFPRGFPAGSEIIDMPFEPESGRWTHIVERFSRASLTKVQDKLAAIAGIAERICQAEKMGYYAGFLEKDMPWSLCWMKTEPLVRTMAPYRAPTWSWASCEGAISFFDNWVEYESICSIDRISLNYVNKTNVYGQLKGGIMTVSATVWHLNVLSITETDELEYIIYGGGLETKNTKAGYHHYEELQCMLNFDEPSLVQDRTGFILILIMRDNLKMCGLILVPQDSSWIRIGTFTLNMYEKLYGMQNEIISLARTCPRTTYHII